MSGPTGGRVIISAGPPITDVLRYMFHIRITFFGYLVPMLSKTVFELEVEIYFLFFTITAVLSCINISIGDAFYSFVREADFQINVILSISFVEVERVV